MNDVSFLPTEHQEFAHVNDLHTATLCAEPVCGDPDRTTIFHGHMTAIDNPPVEVGRRAPCTADMN